MEFFVIYLFVMIEKITALLDKGYALAGIGAIGIALVMFFAGMSSQDNPGKTFSDQLATPLGKRGMRVGKAALIIGLLLGVLSEVIPDQKQLAIIVGTGVTYNVVTSEPAKRIGGKALELFEQQIDKALGGEGIKIPESVKKEAKAAIVEKVEGKAL